MCARRSKAPKTQNSQLGGTIRPCGQPPPGFSTAGSFVTPRELNFKPLSVDVLPREVVERWCYILLHLRLAVVSPVSRHGSTSDIAPYGLLDMNRLHSAWNQSILDCFAERHPSFAGPSYNKIGDGIICCSAIESVLLQVVVT